MSLHAGTNYYRAKDCKTNVEKRLDSQRDQNTLTNPHRIVDTTDMRWRADGSKRHDPAKAYIREDGHYVVRNEVDGTLVQIRNYNKSYWQSP